jgi:adenylylsulfate kinase-like enzyme
MEPEEFHEVYINADLRTCEHRDPKGLYKRARAGEIPNFTGVGAPYEPPLTPEFVVDTQGSDADSCIEALVGYCLRVFVPSGCAMVAMTTAAALETPAER